MLKLLMKKSMNIFNEHKNVFLLNTNIRILIGTRFYDMKYI